MIKITQHFCRSRQHCKYCNTTATGLLKNYKWEISGTLRNAPRGAKETTIFVFSADFIPTINYRALGEFFHTHKCPGNLITVCKP